MRHRALVYADDGADARCVAMAVRFLQQLLPAAIEVAPVLAPELVAGAWVTTTAILVMPGGADRPYVAKLDGAGTAAIRAFVADHGGLYVGFCAGAYFAAATLSFDAGGPLAVTGARTLQFFPGCAVGPLFPGFAYGSPAGAHAALVSSLSSGEGGEGGEGGAVTPVYFNGGCAFVAAAAADADADAADMTVLAIYSEAGRMTRAARQLVTSPAPAAVVRVRVGRGHALLSGVHWEYNPAWLPPDAQAALPVGVAAALAEATFAANAQCFAQWLLPLLPAAVA